jgi:threonine dehydrogenase-like Zn-dependent dehydrogenase
MRATVLYSPGDVRCVEVEDPEIIEPTDAVIKLSASCICGSDPGHIVDFSPSASPQIWVMNIAVSSSRSDRPLRP